MTSLLNPQRSYWLPSRSAHDPGGWRHLCDAAKIADETEIDRIVVSDHVVFGENLEAYGDPKLGGSAGGRQPTGPDGHWLDPLTVLTYVAGFATSVRLGTAILIAALRRPAVLGERTGHPDVLSGGRVDLGVGVGWQREEYEVAGLDFEGRGRLLDHTLEVCQTLWRQEQASFEDDLLQFDAIHQMPKPLQSGGVPIWVSGTLNRNVVRRLSAYGSGWIPWGPAAENLKSSIPQMKQAMTDAGRPDADALQVVGFLPLTYDGSSLHLEATIEATKPLIDAGVTGFRVSVRFTGSYETDKATVLDIVTWFAKAFR
nr:TIGR03619 family F420-dependent LLM class oxidoreductase [Mycobacterium sp. RTGN5]